MLCEDVMKRRIESVSPDETVATAAMRMRDENVGFLPVCDEKAHVIGTLTDRDIALRVVAERRPSSITVNLVMSKDVVACRPGDELEIAARLMETNHKSRIMCIDISGRLVGIISLSDLAQLDGSRAVGALREVSVREFHA
jgi:CBS domain-containing protein